MRPSVVRRRLASMSRVQHSRAEEQHGEEQHDPPLPRHLARVYERVPRPSIHNALIARPPSTLTTVPVTLSLPTRNNTARTTSDAPTQLPRIV
jgi:hypothetical protein